jgi:hypothetical protein
MEDPGMEPRGLGGLSTGLLLLYNYGQIRCYNRVTAETEKRIRIAVVLLRLLGVSIISFPAARLFVSVFEVLLLRQSHSRSDLTCRLPFSCNVIIAVLVEIGEGRTGRSLRCVSKSDHCRARESRVSRAGA